MPNWKKLVISGSDASLSSLLVTNAVTASIVSASQFSGSLFGTASWSNNAVSASYVKLLAGPYITINYQSNGIAITGSAGGSGTPGGANTNIQFNDGGSFGGQNTFTFDKTTNEVQLTGSLSLSGSFNITDNLNIPAILVNDTTRLLYDTSTSQSINWNDRTLRSQNGYKKVWWGDGRNTIYGDNNDGSDFDESIKWGNRELYDKSDGVGAFNKKSIDWHLRQLFDSTGTSVALEYSDTTTSDKVRLYGTSSYALTASYLVGSAAQIETQRNNTNGTYYLTFVDSSNVTPAPELLYTDSEISYNPGADTLTVTNITASLFGTSSWARNSVTASYVTGSVFTSTNPALSASYAATASYVNGLIIKSNAIQNTSFGGSPLTASVTFTTGFPNTSLTVTVTGTDSRAWAVQSLTKDGFVVNSNSSQALTGKVYWQAMSIGEFIQ